MITSHLPCLFPLAWSQRINLFYMELLGTKPRALCMLDCHWVTSWSSLNTHLRGGECRLPGTDWYESQRKWVVERWLKCLLLHHSTTLAFSQHASRNSLYSLDFEALNTRGCVCCCYLEYCLLPNWHLLNASRVSSAAQDSTLGHKA